MTTNSNHEKSPLLLSSSTTYEDEDEVAQGSATVSQTILNLSKTSMGTGCLALPVAAREGGLLLFVFGVVAIALWNAYASKKYCDCYDLIFGSKGHDEIENDKSLVKSSTPSSCDEGLASCCPPPPVFVQTRSLPRPPPGTATLGSIAWYTVGPSGLAILDLLTLILLMGVIVAYNDAIRTFLQDTPFTTGHDAFDAIITAFLIAPLTVVKDMGFLSKTSAAGLSVLAFALLVIAGYGILGSSSSSDTASALQWFPRNGLAGVSNWFGCVVYGFGIVPLTFNFRDSMAEPSKYTPTCFYALLLVALIYIIVGISLLALYPDIDADVLSAIPQLGILPTITRLAMVVVVVATAPLLIVPCAELIEGKISRGEAGQRTKVLVRFGICFLTVAISVGVPGFVSVLTFVGCFCVSFVSFCVSPALHVVLLIRHKRPIRALVFDVLMLAWGLAATAISTAFVFRKITSRTGS